MDGTPASRSIEPRITRVANPFRGAYSCPISKASTPPVSTPDATAKPRRSFGGRSVIPPRRETFFSVACRTDPPGGQSENQVDRKDEEQQHRTGRNQCPLLHLPGLAHLHDNVCRQHAEGGKQSPREYRRIARDHHHRHGLPHCASDCRNERCANAGVRDHYSSFRIPRLPQEGFALVKLL